MAHSVENLL